MYINTNPLRITLGEVEPFCPRNYDGFLIISAIDKYVFLIVMPPFIGF